MPTTLLIAATLISLALAADRIADMFRRGRSLPKRPPLYETVKRFESPDARRALEILRGDHGLFRFEEMKWRQPDADDLYEIEGCWTPAMCSGLYESAEVAERDARAQVAWLRDTTDD